MEKILDVVDSHWAEIADSLTVIETLAEDESFPHRELAAFVASKVFYHLEEYDDSLRLALTCGRYFNVSSNHQYEVTVVGKCIERYITLRSEGSPLDARLTAIVEDMFTKCYMLGSFKQALGIALEAQHLEKVESSVVKSGDMLPGMLRYCLSVCQNLVTNRKFRLEVIEVLVGLYESQGSKCNYIELATCLHYLGHVKKYAQLLVSLLADDNNYLIAFQCAFDLVELQDQHFEVELVSELPKDDEDKRLCSLREILSEGISTAMYLDFLYRNNKTDALGLKHLKQAVEQGRKISVLHNASIVAHGYMQAGTSVDSFLRNNLEWLGRASNWAKFSATASLGVIHKGNVTPSMQLLQPYLPADLASGVSASPFSEGGALYALGLIHAGQGHSTKGTEALAYLAEALEGASRQENDASREPLQHGACLGIGLVAMSSGDPVLQEKLQNIVYNDNAIAGEAAALAMGMNMLGGGSQHAATVEDLLSYAHDTQHEKIIRALALAVAMSMYGQEENAEAMIEQLCRDKDPLLRFGGMYTIGMAFAGTANNAAIRKLLHVAVSDVANDVRRAAVTCLGLVMLNVPQRLPELVALLSESYNPHVRYGSCMALAIGCSSMDNPTEALVLLNTLLEDKVDFVKQGALIASSILLMQHNPEFSPKSKALRAKLSETISDVKHSPTMARMGAIMGTGIIDAGGRNVTIELLARNGFTKAPAVVGMVLWTQYWYWYPMMHMLSLSFTPTCLIGVNDELDLPKNFVVECPNVDLKQFNYPKPLEEKKEKKQVRVKTVVLSMTAKAKARESLKHHGDVVMEDPEDDTEQTEEEARQKKEAQDDKECATNLTNPLRVTPFQNKYIVYNKDQRYLPAVESHHKSGIVVLRDCAPGEPGEIIKFAVPPSGEEDDTSVEPRPPAAFEWTEPDN